MPQGPALSISIAGDMKRLTLGKPFNDALIYTLGTTSIQNLRPFCLGINSKKISQTNTHGLMAQVQASTTSDQMGLYIFQDTLAN